ncbi:hypothetical protein COCMIDRAFT_7015 [Bipolaris oryzae ATCC 44560]|uniref:Carrier domain-containing protein n=1 Tax=Bipolaris oryzae ATCC 44560 TaxID=930090 RepID=W6YVY8_COCMI|nr:uncharacterized protein COCMIDRAFT_7015 [Bipolaris oryzae ATCC 44560]EUC43582.1 hypothetical protein COCMIDRAFT_7015 [Bipolaris oryzae ATCC 44560]
MAIIENAIQSSSTSYQPNTTLSAMSNSISPEDYQEIIERYNDTLDTTILGHSLPRLLQNTAERHHDKIAMICGDEKVTFGTLTTLATQLAHVLVTQGIGRGEVVGIALDRSIDLVVALLAVMRTGAAYMPIDPGFPTDRIRHMIEDANPILVIVSASTRLASQSWGCATLGLDETRDMMVASKSQIDDVDTDPKAEDLAYVIYTSGSTGKPKGVEISHGALSNFLCAMQREPGCVETDRLLAITTISFDIAALEVFLPLLCGATMIMAQAHEVKDPEATLGLIQQHNVTMMQATPATWQMLLDAGWKGDPRLSRILCGGEALSRRLADRLLLCAESVWNMYGPTEATVWASIWKVCPGKDVVIGKPITNYQLYVLDESLRPVPFGCTGELYIGGVSLANGYRNMPEVTQSRFVRNPFHNGLIYRTGDIAKFDGPDRLIVLGRADGQVKIRGYRIELGDIEAAITDHSDILDAVVISRNDRLIAYCISVDGESSHEIEATPTLDSVLRPWLAQLLPAYMMPAFFVSLKTFPMTPNNKVDRKALPDPKVAVKSKLSRPLTDLEDKLRVIWAKVLGHNCIGLDDNFFEIGGDSVRVIQMQKQVQKLVHWKLSPARLFQHYTIKTLSAYLKGEGEITTDPISSQNHRISPDNEDIAIVSMACRLPGQIASPEEYWDLLENGADVIIDVPKDRWDADALYDPNPGTPGKSYCRRGGFMSSIDEFDASFFGISPKEARAMDPAQRIVLETCCEGFERAGYTDRQLRGSRTGVFMGVCSMPAHSTAPCLQELSGYDATGSAGATMSGRLSYALGLEGPALTVDTACSSSLVTTHLACNALRQGECDMAVSGGITLLLTPGMHVEFSQLKGMSADGRCRAFAEDTQGTGWAEGCTMVLLKRLSDAIRDGDKVHALLRGTAVNHGGRSAPGLTVPSGMAQQRLVHAALASANLAPSDIDYVEAHGTGTKLGDPIEGTALAEVFGESRTTESEPLWIGSVKSNIGHTQAAAGLAGLLKVVLAMQHNTIPRTLHAEKPTSAVDWQGANMALVQEPQPWLPRADRPRRAGISAFGIGGTNAHVIIEEAPLKDETSHPLPALLPAGFPFLLSGHTDAALRQQADKLRRYIASAKENHGDRLGHMAFSLATTRNHYRRRRVLLAKDKTELMYKLSSMAGTSENAADPCIAVLFTGQGSQVVGMGKDLYDIYPVFHDAVDDIAAHFTELEMPLREVMHAAPDSEAAALLQRTDFAQPALFTLEVALWHLWKSWGVEPNYVLGHSVGELSAAHVSGILDLSDACRLVAARGRLMQAVPTRGSMVALEASAEEVSRTMDTIGVVNKVDIAGHNTPRQTVISGDCDAVEKLVAYFTGLGRKKNVLDVSHAFHSHHMDCMLAAFQAVADSVQFHPPKLWIVSSLTGKPVEADELQQPDYWVSQARSAVRFADGIQILHQQGVNIFLELGPQAVLSGLGAACLVADQSVAWLPSLTTRKPGASTMQSSLAEMHERMVSISWHAYFELLGYCERVELPTYAFQRERFPRARSRINADSVQQHDQSQDQHETLSAVDRFAFEVSWQQADRSNLRKGGSWGLLCASPDGEQGWIRRFEAGLMSAGLYVQRIERLQDGGELDGVLCLWNAETDSDDVADQARELTAKGLAQLQDAASTQFMSQLLWVTHNAVGASVNARDDNHYSGTGLAAGPLWGLMRTARSEHPDLHLRLLDIDYHHDDNNDSDDDINVDALAAALALRSEPECAVRHGQVLVPRLQPIAMPQELPPPTQQQQPMVRPDGAVVITGGLGDLGARVARWLATAHGVRTLVLTSRRGMAAPGAQALVNDLAALGAEATVVSCDIADRQSVQQLMAMFDDNKTPLRGVVHAAGAQDNGVLRALTPQRCATVFAPKVDGAWHLHQLTQHLSLDFFVMFSSISGVLSMSGLANYAAANTFLDALAYLRHAQGLPATSVAYGPWEGDGMAANIIGPTRARLAQSGLDMLAPEDGLELLGYAVRSHRTLTVAAALDQPRLKKCHRERGDNPPFLRSILSGGNAEEQPLNSGYHLRKELLLADLEQRPQLMLAMLQETVAKALGFKKPSDVHVDKPLQDIGIDSLTAVLIRNQLANLTGMPLMANITFQHPNLKALGQTLLSELNLNDSESGSSLGSSTATTTLMSDMVPLLDLEAIKRGCVDPSFTFENAGEAPTSPSSVFITGATGFVGAHITHDLMEFGIAVYCLVRAETDDEAMERLIAALASYSLWNPEYTPLLHCVVGDMSQPLFGLPEHTFDFLADHVDAICHSGALVDWMRPLQDYIGPNMVSAHEVLRLTSQGKAKTVHLISTMSTIPKYMGYDVKEGDQEYGYATSKYGAERMMAAAQWRGAKVSVYRLPFVTASSTTGRFRLDRGDFLHHFIAGCVEMDLFPSIDANLAAVLPVDYLSKTIVTMMTKDLHLIGQNYDFANAHAPTFSHFFQLMSDASTGQEIVPFLAWRERALNYALAHRSSLIARITALIDGVIDDKGATAMVTGPPLKDNVLGSAHFPAPLVDADFARKYVRCISTCAG